MGVVEKFGVGGKWLVQPFFHLPKIREYSFTRIFYGWFYKEICKQ
jgi:hypothetical protein